MISHREILLLEEVGFATWPALVEERVDGWLLRAAGGATRRANSASPVDVAGRPVDQQITQCETWYEARQLPPIFRLCPAADPAIDAELEARGYVRDAGAVIMTRPAADLFDSAGVQVAMAESPAGSWLDVMARERGRGGAKRGVLVRMFQRLEAPARFAVVLDDATPAAIGLGVLAQDHLALYMMQTVPERRREGFGTAIAAALATWGTDRGARHLFLQVHPENTAARAFYEHLGFEPRYEYWYRQ